MTVSEQEEEQLSRNIAQHLYNYYFRHQRMVGSSNLYFSNYGNSAWKPNPAIIYFLLYRWAS